MRSGVRDFWQFYRRYTNTAAHTASAAALAIFGLLVFLDPWFVLLAIASYVLPPIVLFAVRGTKSEDDAGAAAETVSDPSSPTDLEPSRSDGSRPRRTGGRNGRDGDGRPDVPDGDTDSDDDDGDTDTDRRGSDTDSDSDS